MAEENQGVKPPQELPTEPLPKSYDQLVGTNEAAKTSWPELVGATKEEAEKKIKEEMGGADIHVVPPGFFVTMDFRPQRVRLYVDQAHKVTRPPTLG